MTGFLMGFASALPPISAVQFPGSASYATNTASGAVSTARVRFRVDSVPTTTFKILAGSNNGGGGDGWLISLEDTTGSALVGQLTFYVKVSGGAFARIARKFLLPGDVGKIFTAHVTCDGTNVFAYLDGKKLYKGTACASITAATAGGINIAGNTGGTNSAAVTVIDVAEGTTALTPAQVATDAALTTPSFAGQTHRYTAGSSPGATWTDEVGTNHLTRVGAPTVVSFTPSYAGHKGTLEQIGDSIVCGRRADLGLGDGWRRTLQNNASTNGAPFTTIGYINMTAATEDFDWYATATPGQAMSDRLVTLAADLLLVGAADTATLIAYGCNDIVALNHSAATLQADITTAVGLVVAARPGRPVFVCCPMQVATSAATAPQRTQLAAMQTGFAAFITTLKGTYPTVVGIDFTALITNPDDTAQLYDGTHPAPAMYAAIGAAIQPIVSAAL